MIKGDIRFGSLADVAVRSTYVAMGGVTTVGPLSAR
jgi:hypothetical protein